MECPRNTSVIIDNSPIECDAYISSACVLHVPPLPFLSLPANSPQKDINTSIVNTLITQNNTINLLELGGFTNADLEIDGTYNLQATDDKKYISVNSITNSPQISLNTSLPDGFECYILNNTPVLSSGSLDDVLIVDTEFTTPPLFTIPRTPFSLVSDLEDVVKNYGVIHIKKQNSNLYTVTGDLTYFPS